jgi:hypothetical protein
MTPAIQMAYAVHHLYAPNESPYAPATRSGRSAGRRRRRRSPMAIAFPRISGFGRRGVALS